MQIKAIDLCALSYLRKVSVPTVANDTDRYLDISLDIDMSSISTAVLYCKKDSTTLTSTGTITNGKVRVKIPTLTEGTWKSSLKLTDTSSKVITTFPFEIRTEETYAN